jgi:hypothetical protein
VKKFALGRKNYWLSVADASSAPFFLAWEIWVRHSPLGDVALAGASGYMVWGLSEYAFHRWVYHQRHGILGYGHRIHHEAPGMLIAMPWLMTTQRFSDSGISAPSCCAFRFLQPAWQVGWRGAFGTPSSTIAIITGTPGRGGYAS